MSQKQNLCTTIFICLAISSCGGSQPPPQDSVSWREGGAECRTALRLRSGALAKCNFAGACAQVAATPNRKVAFVFGVEIGDGTADNGTELSVAKQKQNWECIYAAAGRLGLSLHGTLLTGYSTFIATGTYKMADELRKLALIQNMEVGCYNNVGIETCRECLAHNSEDQCDADRMCRSLTPVRLLTEIPSEKCVHVGPFEFAGCEPLDFGCDDEFILLRKNGMCYLGSVCGGSGHLGFARARPEECPNPALPACPSGFQPQ